jgi:hypothetical protein
VSFAGALGTAGLSAAMLEYRGWFIGASLGLLAIGFMQVYRRPSECAQRSRVSVVVLWTSAIVVTALLVMPQLIAALLADWLG